MLLWANDFRAVFWVAVVPGIDGRGTPIVRDSGAAVASRQTENQPDQPDNFARLGLAYWWVVGIGTVCHVGSV